ncbi:LuxR C-terminal-related transcriptional regulator [Corynebacterium sp. A21]|uniref:LuxR C-terminal-related transcriptional regulator n=1 Tax=Corynebacterium sp. A21 TaxID=3457318 RepID=UPI003FD36FE4
MFTTGLLPRRLLLLRRILAELRESENGRFLLVTGPSGVNKGHFLRELAAELPAYVLTATRALPGTSALASLPGEIQADAILLIDDIHLAEPADLNRILARVHQTDGPRLILLGSAPIRLDSATDVLSLPPLSVPETAELARQIVGVCDADTAHRIHDVTGGLPQLIRELLDAAELTHWSRPAPTIPLPNYWRDRDLRDDVLRLIALPPEGLDSSLLDAAELIRADEFVAAGVLEHVHGRLRFRRPQHRSVTRADTPPGLEANLRERLGLPVAASRSSALERAESFAEAADLGSARLELESSAEEVSELRGYLAAYAGHRQLAGREFAHAPFSPTLADRQIFHQLANWDMRGIRAWTARSADRDIFEGFLAAVDHGTQPRKLHYEDPRQQQKADLIAGWVSLVFDDAVRARELLSRRVRGDSDLVGLWQAGFLARTHYVLGEWSRAAAVVERGLALSEACETPLLNPLLLWTGAQIAAMSGHLELSRHYLSRMQTSEDSFLIQRLPAAMGRMIITSTSAELGDALRAGKNLRDIVRQQDTQQPGFWPWEDIYANSLVAAGHVDAADEVITGAEARYRDSGIVSLHAKNLVPRASIQIQRGMTRAGVSSLEDAVDSISGMNLPAYEARILFEFGSVLRRIGRRSRAEEFFARAEEVFIMMGATTMVHRCEVERRAGGMGGRRPNRLGLTPQEEQIAVLVAEGATNRGAAQELSLSTKTVEYHLTRVYKKLGLASRAELPQALLRR